MPMQQPPVVETTGAPEIGLPSEEVQKTATVQITHNGEPCPRHPDQVAIFIDTNNNLRFCEACVAQIEAELKEQQDAKKKAGEVVEPEEDSKIRSPQKEESSVQQIDQETKRQLTF